MGRQWNITRCYASTSLLRRYCLCNFQDRRRQQLTATGIGISQHRAPAATEAFVTTHFAATIINTPETVRLKRFRNSSVVDANDSGDLYRFIQDGKKIIISTVQKFPFVLDEIGGDYCARNFAIIIDKAHSSQGGRTAAQMNMALLADGEEGEEKTAEDAINRIMEARKMLKKASYFAFTATPKNKTLEVFGMDVLRRCL